MSVVVSNETNDLIVIKVGGILLFTELEQVQNAARKLITNSKINCLILAEQFAGWGKDGDWGDLTFLYEADPSINKIAVVAPQKWKDEILMFVGAGRRQAAVKCFPTGQEVQARVWLNTK